MNRCYDCNHVEMCGWRKDVEEQGCEFFGDCNEWIPCSERLPNENEWVLCSCNNGFAILILKLKGKVWHKTESAEYLSKFVNAWMPLPAPWKGE